MGVQGLWEVVNKAGQSRSLANLAVIEGFERNNSGKRALRVGVDASIWYQHASFSRGGENPELRLLFFRLRSLAELPLLPLFVFDGRERPKMKRGSRLGKSGSHALTDGMKKMLDIFGMEWRMALGEAEAELAHLNRAGVIDAVMTDDVDALVFGALRVIKNPSLTLSGNKSNPALNSEGKASKHHVMIYTAEAIRKHPEIQLSRGGMVLFAMLVKGDYGEGVKDIGKTTAHALARCGFGDELLAIFHRRGEEDSRQALARWRVTVNTELHTNSRKFLRHAYPSLSLPEDFPDMKLLQNYADPVCSARVGLQGGGPVRDVGELNIARAAAFCEEKFVEWGYKSAIIKRFRDLMWEAATMRLLRRVALEVDEKERERRLGGGLDSVIRGIVVLAPNEAIGTPAPLVKKYLGTSGADRRREAFAASGQHGGLTLIAKIIGSRTHVSTDGLLEYRIEIRPSILVQLATSGIRGTRPEPPMHAPAEPFGADFGDLLQTKKTPKGPPPDPDSGLRIWVPASMMKQAHPDLVAEFDTSLEAKAQRKQCGKGKRRAQAQPEWDTEASDSELPVPLVVPHVRVPRAHPSIPDPPKAIPGTAANDRCTAGSSRLPSISPADRNGFLFVMANSDDPTLIEADDLAVASEDEDDEDPISASDPFERLFNEVMGFDNSPSPHRERCSRKRLNRSTHSTKRDKDSAINRPSKRRKTQRTPAQCDNSPQHSSGGPSRIPSPPIFDPNVVELSGSDDEHTFPLLSVSKPTHRAPRRSRAYLSSSPGIGYPLCPSSQEGNLDVYVDEDIIDLT
ncbi:hypothetical protein HYDPIDRAFT_26013 [Hydnomerulius pinastri MD-312]|nr:hypothetical protein HYDPIDRAFT_26013 [Hydnomerulius pinastri MD-312]